MLPVDSIIGSSRAEPSAGRRGGAYPMESAKTRDITGGLPRVAELFERVVRRITRSSPKSPARCSFGRDYKNKTRIIDRSRTRKAANRSEYLIPKGKHIHLQDGDIVEKGDYIVDGNPAPHDILAIKGVEELAATSSTRSRRSTGSRA